MAQASAQRYTIPSINSSDRDERIAARRIRIESRQAAKNKRISSAEDSNLILLAILISKEKPKEPQLGTGEVAARQIIESRRVFNTVVFDGLEDVTQIRAFTDIREQERRALLERAELEQRRRRQAEKIQSEHTNEEIIQQWEKLSGIDVPEDVLQHIQEQKSACDQVVASKDRLIAEYQKEIKAKEDEYVKALTKQAEDIGTTQIVFSN